MFCGPASIMTPRLKRCDCLINVPWTLLPVKKGPLLGLNGTVLRHVGIYFTVKHDFVTILFCLQRWTKQTWERKRWHEGFSFMLFAEQFYFRFYAVKGLDTQLTWCKYCTWICKHRIQSFGHISLSLWPIQTFTFIN